jgi:septum formation protein
LDKRGRFWYNPKTSTKKGLNVLLVLASASPRREELLRLIAPGFEICPADTDEALPPGILPDEAVRMLARRKAEDVFAKRPHDVVIGADTIVVVDGDILGKPGDGAEAVRMLLRLSGRAHVVKTGVCVLAPGFREAFVESTDVTFAGISEEEARAYAATGEPLDKAGAYAIQGGAARFALRICGDYSNIVGLPLAKLNMTLKNGNLL